MCWSLCAQQPWSESVPTILHLPDRISNVFKKNTDMRKYWALWANMIHKRNSTFTQENVSTFPSELLEKNSLDFKFSHKKGTWWGKVVIENTSKYLEKRVGIDFFIDYVVLNIKIVESFGFLDFFTAILLSRLKNLWKWKEIIRIFLPG